MKRSEFRELVRSAMEGLPPKLKAMVENVDVQVASWATREQLIENEVPRKEELFGLYEGIPLTERTTSYGMVLPDRITIFQGPLELWSHSEEELRSEIQKTVVHEVAHHFGMSDEELSKMGWG